VKCFEDLYQHLRVQIVWFISKSVNGDGFPAWHQDLVKTSTIAVTIVVNVGTIEKNGSLADNDNILCRKMFSGTDEGPRLGTLEEYTHRMNEHQSILSIHEENNAKDSTALEISAMRTPMPSGDVAVVPMLPPIVEADIL
jgi:hypothetical protein